MAKNKTQIRDTMKANRGDLRVWWVPQMPMKAFEVPVASVVEAKLLLDTLAHYDIFQFENRVKPDYSNAGGMQFFDGEEWVDWHPEDDEAFAKVSERMFPDRMPETIDDFTLEEVRRVVAEMPSAMPLQ